MHLRRVAFVLLGVALLAGTAIAQDGDGDADAVPECIEVSGHARYDGTGYLHIVRVQNGCDRVAQCDVWTSVDAERYRLRVAPAAAEEVITRRGSPAYEFTPHARCTLD